MTVLYPRERVKEVLQPLSLATAHRIVLKPYLSDPLIARTSKSRFCDGRTYAVLYAAGDFATAFAEVVVRDRLVQRDRRLVPFGDIAARGWVEFTSTGIVAVIAAHCRIAGRAATRFQRSRGRASGTSSNRSAERQKPMVSPEKIVVIMKKIGHTGTLKSTTPTAGTWAVWTPTQVR
jgi:hypothetical protein